MSDAPAAGLASVYRHHTHYTLNAYSNPIKSRKGFVYSVK